VRACVCRCIPGTYTLFDGKNNSCSKCPAGAVCPGGNKIFPQVFRRLEICFQANILARGRSSVGYSGMLRGYSRGTHGALSENPGEPRGDSTGTRGVLQGYSRVLPRRRTTGRRTTRPSSTRGVIQGYSRGTPGVLQGTPGVLTRRRTTGRRTTRPSSTRGVLQGYSRGTPGVLQGYSRGTPGYS
jgi:hypothetical protein